MIDIFMNGVTFWKKKTLSVPLQSKLTVELEVYIDLIGINLSAVIWNYALGIACKHLPENKLLVVLEWDVYDWYFYERSNFLKKKNIVCSFTE